MNPISQVGAAVEVKKFAAFYMPPPFAPRCESLVTLGFFQGSSECVHWQNSNKHNFIQVFVINKSLDTISNIEKENNRNMLLLHAAALTSRKSVKLYIHFALQRKEKANLFM